MSESLKLHLEAGQQTEDLAKFVLHQLPDEELDAIEVYRQFDRDPQTANEPITIGVVLTVAIGAEATVAAIKAIQSISEAIKAYIEYRTKKLEKEQGPIQSAEKVQVLILGSEIPQAIRSIHGNQQVVVAVTQSEA